MLIQTLHLCIHRQKINDKAYDYFKDDKGILPEVFELIFQVLQISNEKTTEKDVELVQIYLDIFEEIYSEDELKLKKSEAKPGIDIGSNLYYRCLVWNFRIS